MTHRGNRSAYYSVLPYGPEQPKPIVRCGCLEQMKYQPKSGLFAFVCPGCGGMCDVNPPSDHWEHHKCGAIVKGLRCGEPLPRGQSVCETCQKAAIEDLLGKPGGLDYLINRIGRSKVDRKLDVKERLDRAARTKAAEAERLRKAEEKRAARESEAGHVVYYARLGKNHVKVGTTADLARRMVELRVVNVANLLAAEPGGYKTERARHEQFKKWRWDRRKEDFFDAAELMEHIEKVRAEHGDPYELAARLVAESGGSTVACA